MLNQELHRVYVSQIKSYIETLSRILESGSLSQENSPEYQKQFAELKSAILRVPEYRETFHLLEIENPFPDRRKNIVSMLLKLRVSKKYYRDLNNYFTEVVDKLTRVFMYFKNTERFKAVNSEIDEAR